MCLGQNASSVRSGAASRRAGFSVTGTPLAFATDMANPESDRALLSECNRAPGSRRDPRAVTSAPIDDTTISPHDDQSATKDDAPDDVHTPCVLVADDHRDTREAFANELRAAGFRTVEAENGVLALKLAHEVHPDAILLDYAMPMMDGLQAAHCLRRDPRTAGIPIVMVTAFRSLVAASGRYEAVVDKPCDPRDVVATLKAVIDRKRR